LNGDKLVDLIPQDVLVIGAQQFKFIEGVRNQVIFAVAVAFPSVVSRRRSQPFNARNLVGQPQVEGITLVNGLPVTLGFEEVERIEGEVVCHRIFSDISRGPFRCLKQLLKEVLHGVGTHTRNVRSFVIAAVQGDGGRNAQIIRNVSI